MDFEARKYTISLAGVESYLGATSNGQRLHYPSSAAPEGAPVMETMNSHTAEAIQRAIDKIYKNIGERITIDDLARTAMFSKFHFTRLFQRATGVSPGRFLSAVRLQEAKRLLLSTSLSVTEISHQVGYASVGTFSSRFKESVGLSPTAYRELRGFAPRIMTETKARQGRTTTVWGEVVPAPGEQEGPVFIGLFPDTIPEGAPLRCTVLWRPGRFELTSVPQGTWYILAQSVSPGQEEVIGDRPPTVAAQGPISVRSGTVAEPVEVRLRAMRVVDPPVLVALLDARRVALQRVGLEANPEASA